MQNAHREAAESAHPVPQDLLLNAGEPQGEVAPSEDTTVDPSEDWGGGEADPSEGWGDDGPRSYAPPAEDGALPGKEDYPGQNQPPDHEPTQW